VLTSGLGDDTLTGGDGADCFVFRLQSPSEENPLGVGGGSNVILDYRAEDKLVFEGEGLGIASAWRGVVDRSVVNVWLTLTDGTEVYLPSSLSAFRSQGYDIMPPPDPGAPVFASVLSIDSPILPIEDEIDADPL